jgi:nitrile hydratase accessory protein
MRKSLKDLMKSRGLTASDSNFAEPWEARAFALALSLSESGRLVWEDFRQRLITEISQADKNVGSGKPGAGYYQCWLHALEAVLSATGMADTHEIDSRADLITANPPTPTKAASTGPIKIA